MTNHSKNKKQNHSRLLRPLPLILLVIGGVFVVILILELTNTTHFFHKSVAKTAVISSTSSSASKPSPKTSAPTTSSSSTGSSTSAGASSPTSSSTGATTKDIGSTTPAPSTTPTTTGPPPAMPSGTFISNHNPDLSGKPYPSQELSVCNTTPGATCAIKFTNGSLTRTLPSQTTDANGSTSWKWDVNQAGFTQGTWTVNVTATLNGQTATAQDTLKVGS